MTIEPTDEMIVAFEQAADDVGITGGNTRAGIAAVLALVERDHLVLRRHSDPCGNDPRSHAGGQHMFCQREAGHTADHTFVYGPGQMMQWTTPHVRPRYSSCPPGCPGLAAGTEASR